MTHTQEGRDRMLVAMRHASAVMKVLEDTNVDGIHDKRIAGVLEMIIKLDNLWSC